MKKYYVVVLISFLLTACGGDSSHAFNPAPTLVRFDIVDSYGTDTGFSSKSLALNPYIDNGLFDIFWRVNSLENYRINVRINDVPDVNNSILFYSDVCGAGGRCDQMGNVICEYTSDFFLSCNNARYPADIALLFKRVPQTLYLLVEICDIDSPRCTFQYYPVSME